MKAVLQTGYGAPGEVLALGEVLAPREDLEALKGMIDDGAVRPVIGECRPLEEAAIAVERAGSGHARGKVVVTA